MEAAQSEVRVCDSVDASANTRSSVFSCPRNSAWRAIIAKGSPPPAYSRRSDSPTSSSAVTAHTRSGTRTPSGMNAGPSLEASQPVMSPLRLCTSATAQSSLR
ncbi:Uncharacterised protein [Mycobacteroides abscessus subsp. abscessus]|nr:Uncharacterised protein [Mycobacteroides abscessus subsp. abscessus]